VFALALCVLLCPVVNEVQLPEPTKDKKVHKEKRSFDLFSSYKNLLEWRAAIELCGAERDEKTWQNTSLHWDWSRTSFDCGHQRDHRLAAVHGSESTASDLAQIRSDTATPAARPLSCRGINRMFGMPLPARLEQA
jgi:hypothetical protein